MAGMVCAFAFDAWRRIGESPKSIEVFVANVLATENVTTAIWRVPVENV